MKEKPVDKIEDKVMEIGLFPCAGSKKYPKNHIYAVSEFLESGKQIQGIDFMSKEEAIKKYEPIGLKVIVTKSHGSCPECIISNYYPELKKEEILKKFFPNYKGR